MRRGTPKRSISSMANGSAASDDAVENAMSHGSLTARMKRRTGTRASVATGHNTPTANTTSATYSVPTSSPSPRNTPNPFLPTVYAIAPPMPNGANAITSAVNLNITSDRLSQNASIVCLGPLRTRVTATPNNTAKNTICSTSLFAADSAMLCGTTWMSTVSALMWVDASDVACAVDADAIFTPSPGLITLTAMSPTASARVVMTSKYTMERIARRPTRLRS